jgi:hypothetical protein
MMRSGSISVGVVPSQGNGALPPNNWMELTGKSVTPFAKRRAKVAPLLPAAHPER